MSVCVCVCVCVLVCVVCWCVCVFVCVCVPACLWCVCLCVSAYTILKNNGSIHLKIEHIAVYENSSDEFEIVQFQITAKVTA